MKKYVVGFCLFILCTASWALMPPSYLSVPRWQSCVKTVTRGSAKFVCLPAVKPRRCPRSSWESDDLKSIDLCP